MRDHRHLFEIESRKARSVRATLTRFWGYFKGRRLLLGLVLIFAVFSAWPRCSARTCSARPSTATDALRPAGNGRALDGAAQSASSNCWFDDSTGPLTARTPSPGWAPSCCCWSRCSSAPAATGLQFYLMRWAGLHGCATCASDLPPHHRLSLGYYAKTRQATS